MKPLNDRPSARLKVAEGAAQKNVDAQILGTFGQRQWVCPAKYLCVLVSTEVEGFGSPSSKINGTCDAVECRRRKCGEMI